MIANEIAESQGEKQISIRGCSAYGVILQSVQDENHDYETIPLRPLPGPPHLQAQDNSPTSSLQDVFQYETIQVGSTLQSRTTFSGAQSRIDTSSLSIPQELDDDEYDTCDTFTNATPSLVTPTTTATIPTAVSPGDQEDQGYEIVGLPQ